MGPIRAEEEALQCLLRATLVPAPGHLGWSGDMGLLGMVVEGAGREGQRDGS